MRIRYILLVQILLLLSCHVKAVQSKFNGTWSYSNEYKGIELILEDGYFIKTNYNDDVVNVSKGKYLITSNPNRVMNTICLIPNIQFYDSGDTVMLPCEFIDVLFISDSTMDVSFAKDRLQSKMVVRFTRD